MCTSKLKKIIKKVDPLMGGDAILDKVGLPSMFGDEFGMVKDEAAIATGSTVAAPDAPTEVDAGVLAARDDEKRRRAAASGQNSTILTGSDGVTTRANVGRKTLLGA